MVPTAEGPAFEVVEPEFTFEVLVHALRSPALLDDANEFLVAHPTWQCGEVKLGALVFVRPPLDDQPRRLTLRDGDAILVQRLDPAEGEATAQRTFRALLPTQLPAPSMRDGFGQIRYRHRGPQALVAAHAPHLGLVTDPHRVVEAERDYPLPKRSAATVGTVGEYDLARYLGSSCPLNHPERQLDLGLEDHLVWNSCLGSTLGVLGPLLREVKLKVDRRMLAGRRDLQADAHLAIGDLACRAGVLPMHAHQNGFPI